MTQVWCGGADDSADVVLNPAPDGTVRLDLRGIAGGFTAPLRDDVTDFIELASYVYLADGSVSRGRKNSPTAANWHRDLNLSVPVRETATWSRPEVRDALERALSFTTDDSWSIAFRDAPAFDAQLRLSLQLADEAPTCVALFSGGLDSLAVTLRLLEAGERPVLVSHHSHPIISQAQAHLLELLHDHFGRPMVHLRLHTVRRGGDALEYSQRSRGFMYMATAAAVARQAGIGRVVVGENGVTSLNLAQSAQSPGAMRSRTTHPLTIARIQEILDLVGWEIGIETPLATATKAEVIGEALRVAPPSLVHAAVSCARTFARTKSQPHCGTCSQCVDRRLAGIAAGWDDDVEVQSHQIDLLRDPLHDGDDATYAEHYVRFAAELRAVSRDEFVLRHPELWDAVPPDADPGESISAWYELERRHAEQVVAAFQTVWAAAGPQLLVGGLPPDGLFRRIGTGEHLLERWQVFGERLAEVARAGLRPAFAGRAPQNEAEVQRQMQAAFAAAGERLVREGPTVPFRLVGVGTRPDFSAEDAELFVEVKLVRDQASKRRAVEEMLADVQKVAEHSKAALFVVWDSGGIIFDDREFAAAIERTGPAVRVVVLR